MSESAPAQVISFVNRHRAASILGCSPDTISNLIRAGRLKASDIGLGRNRHYRIAVAELERFQREATMPIVTERKRTRRKPFKPLA